MRAVQVAHRDVSTEMTAVPHSMPRREMMVSWEESFCSLAQPSPLSASHRDRITTIFMGK